MEGIPSNDSSKSSEKNEAEAHAERQEKREQIMSSTIEQFQEKFENDETPLSFHIGGREYTEMSSDADVMLANAEKSTRIAQEMLDQVRAEDGGYETEKAIAGLVALFEAEEQVAAETASLKKRYPETMGQLDVTD